MTDVRERLTAFLRETLRIEVVATDEDLLETGRLDSLGLVELLYFLEQQFGVSIDVGALELEDLRSVDAISRLVETARE